jgi:hypothetical protein
MAKQLEAAQDGGSARRAVIQLAAVLSVVHTLRTMEQRTEWRSKHLKLVDPDHEWQLLETGGLALAWNSESLGPRAVKEGHGESFQELSMATGLLAWLAWDTELDVLAALERTTPIDLEEEDDPWYPIQVFASVASLLSGDIEARDILKHAVERTARKGTDGIAWVARHLRLADRLKAVAANLESDKAPGRSAHVGDLVVLGPTVDPRVRVVLEVVPSGASDKVTVFDYANDEGRRQFLATHVNCVAWVGRDDTTARRAGS